MWIDYVDNIFVVNRIDRPHRLERTRKELDCFGIDFTTWTATKNKDGKAGLRDTMRYLFEYCLESSYNWVCVFEDDIKILSLKFNDFMAECIEQLPTDFDLFYLGGNVYKEPTRISPNILQTPVIYATHAIIYSKKAIERIYNDLSTSDQAYDVMLVKGIQKRGKCYCAYPLLISQYGGYSDILGREVNYETFIEKRYAEKTKNL